MVDRWESSAVPRGAEYDRRFDDLAASGMDMHGEAALVSSLVSTPATRPGAVTGPARILDAGCGTGRVAIELNRRGHDVVGVDFDVAMLAAARAKAPDMTWMQGDLADPDLDLDLDGAVARTFDAVVMAGNVLIFVPSGSEGQVIGNAARWLRPGGYLVSGYSIRPGAGFDPETHDMLATRVGLALQDRWSTWDGRPYAPGDDYAVAVHRRAD